VVRWSAASLELQTSVVRHRLELGQGALVRTGWENRRTGTDLIAGRRLADFSFRSGENQVSSDEPGWQVAEPVCQRGAHGELQVSVALARDGWQVTRHYVVYPGLSLVRGWLEIANRGNEPRTRTDPPIVSLQSASATPELLWMSGAEQFGDSWRLRTEPLSATPRVFDSYDVPPNAGNAGLAGDGVDARVMLNDQVVWPAQGWAHSAHANDPQTHDVTVDVKEGDQVLFVLGRAEQMTCDTTEWDPVVTYADGQSFRASEGFSTTQGQGGWRYLYLGDDGARRELTYADVPGRYGQRWRLDVNIIEPFVSANEMHPDPRGCAVRSFTAPRAGRVTIRGTLRNTGNGAPPGPGFRMGTQTYAPWFCVKAGDAGAAAYAGFDCMAQQGFMEVLRRFLDAHPECAFQGVNGGGRALNWEYLSYASGFQFTDGQAGALADYYASYLFPPDKINNMPDIWDPAKYDPATWRGLLCSNFDLTGDTFDPAKLEGLRDVIDVYHYLQARGVVGRWVRVYHPVIDGDDNTMYLQRLSWDRQRGIVITKHKIEGTVTIRPKGLVEDQRYQVCFHDSPAAFERTGRELRDPGLTLTDPPPGELIYLNLLDHPGNRVDKTPPSAPTDVRCAVARQRGVPGVEVTWRPATDESWLSHYQLRRDGALLDRIAKGCFYFNHSAGADPAARYAVVAVDGAGNSSAAAVTPDTDLTRRRILDGTNGGGIAFEGEWHRERGFPPAPDAPLPSAAGAGAAFTVRFTGRSVTWHSCLGAEGGLARVTLDNDQPETVTCYAADEIPGWPLFERQWPTAGPHALRVDVLGQPDPRGAGTLV